MKKQIIINNDFIDTIRPLFAGERRCERSHSFGPCVRDYWLLHCVLSGKGVYKTGDMSFEVVKGETFVIKPEEVAFYMADNEQPWHYVWMAFSVKDSLFDLPYILNNERLYKINERLSKENILDNGSGYALASAFYEMLHCMLPNMTVKSQSPVEEAKSIIRQQYMTNLSVSEIASRLGFDRSYFSNLFKAKTGKSPMQYLTDYRMKMALSMLQKDIYSVSVVANSVGYGDVFGFSRYFKKYYGVSPKNYKQITN